MRSLANYFQMFGRHGWFWLANACWWIFFSLAACQNHSHFASLRALISSPGLYARTALLLDFHHIKLTHSWIFTCWGFATLTSWLIAPELLGGTTLPDGLWSCNWNVCQQKQTRGKLQKTTTQAFWAFLQGQWNKTHRFRWFLSHTLKKTCGLHYFLQAATLISS